MLEESAKPKPPKRWPGVVFSLIVPGFGQVRSGRILRGVAWFAVLQIVSVVLALLCIATSVSTWLVLAWFVVTLGCFVAMLVDSFRPGRMNGRLWLIFLIVAVAVIFVPPLPAFLTRAFKIPSNNMAPTLLAPRPGQADHVIADRITYSFSPPQRGDLVIFRTTGINKIQSSLPRGVPFQFYTMRLIGLPGEKIQIRDGHVFANGRQLGLVDSIPDVKYEEGPGGAAEFEVPEDAYFVLGDNSSHSFDSRYWGFVPKENIFGRVARIYYPFSRMGVPR